MIQKWIVNPVGVRCNLRCAYCICGFVYEDRPGMRQAMKADTVERLLLLVREAGVDEVYLHWHGGEPLLAGLEFYRRLFALQRERLSPVMRVYNSVTTNGLLLSPDWVDLFEDANLNVVVSLDGPDLRHNGHRFRTERDFHHVLEAVDLLRRRRVPLELSMVVNEANCRDARRICTACADLGVEQLRLLPCRHVDSEGRLSTASVAPEPYGRFLIDLFDAWLEHGKPFRVAPFAIVFRGIASGRFEACYLRGVCTTVHLEPDGRVYGSCLVTNGDTELGSVHIDTMAELSSRLETMCSPPFASELLREIILDGRHLPIPAAGTARRRFCPYRDAATSAYAYLKSFHMLASHVRRAAGLSGATSAHTEDRPE